MASVYYLYDDAIHVADDIVCKYSQKYKNVKGNHLAANLIQRAYRGYVVRKKIKNMHKAATILQKYIRGWMVRFNLPENMMVEYDKKCIDFYNRMATKIQACWRGLLVRREINLQSNDTRIGEQRSGFGGDFVTEVEKEESTSNVQKGEDEDIPDGGDWYTNEKFFKEKILAMLFDRHHLLSTKVQKGVLANQCDELTEIEKVLASMPWKGYMNKLRKIYNKYYLGNVCSRRLYMFNHKKLKKQEDLLRLRDTRNDQKEISMKDFIADKRKPFILSSKLEKHPYERRLSLQGEYFVPETAIVRVEDKTKNICEKDFILTLRKIVKKSKVPPYYADFWYKECYGHYFIDL